MHGRGSRRVSRIRSAELPGRGDDVGGGERGGDRRRGRLRKTLGYSGGEYEVEQYEGDGVSTFEVLVFAPNGHRLTPEQYVAAEQAVTDVLTGAHVDVDRVAVFGITR